jgi:multicomponent K+:H+ antiporter subunit A
MLSVPSLGFRGGIASLRIFSLVVILGAAFATIAFNRDFAAILAMGVSGLAVAVLMVLEPSPDVALVQIVVDILAMVILVLALERLPRLQRHRARQLTYRQSRPSLLRDLLIAVGAGLLMTLLTLLALTSRPRESLVTPFFEANAKALTGAKDIIGAIVIDFRALDTLIEITVFALAGMGIYTLLRYASRKHNDQVPDPPPAMAKLLHTTGIGGQETSSFLHALAYVLLPLAMLIAIVHIIYGHDQPGDGFTAGVIISLALGFWYVIFGYETTKRRLGWVKPTPLIGTGILLAIGAGLAGVLFNGSFLSPVNFGAMLHLPLPAGFYLSTSFLFELAICLAVLGSASYMLDTLGHPGD